MKFITIIKFMQEKTEKLYKTVGSLISRLRKEKGIKYTDFCYGYDIPTSTYDDIVNGKHKVSFYNVAKIVNALGLNFEEFGRLLDAELPENFLSYEE